MLAMTNKANPNSNVIVTELDGEAVLLHLDTKMYYSLNATGLFIWRLLSPEHTLADISEKLRAAHAISAEKARASVSNLIHSLQSEKLVDVSVD